MAEDKTKQEEQIEAEEKDEIAEVVEEAAETVETVDADAEIVADETEEAEEAKAEKKPAKTTKAGKNSAKAVREAEEEENRKAEAKTKTEEAPKPKVIQKPNPLKQHGKNYREVAKLVDRNKHYELAEAIALAKQTAKTKFDPSVELHINLGVDPRQADQMVRATVVLPAGTGKDVKIAVLAPADKHAAAKKAGAVIVSDGDLIAKIDKGQLDFDVLISTPDMMAQLGKVAKVLGPRGLMPNPKSGTVTPNVASAVEQAKAGQVEFRIDKQAIIHTAIGKASFTQEQLESNAKALVDAVMKNKPSSTKGTYVKAVSMATSMGPGIKLDVQQVIAVANPKN